MLLLIIGKELRQLPLHVKSLHKDGIFLLHKDERFSKQNAFLITKAQIVQRIANLQGMFPIYGWTWSQPMREGVTYATSSLIGWTLQNMRPDITYQHLVIFTSLATWPYFRHLVQSNKKSLCYRPLVMGVHWWLDSPHKGPVMGKAFPGKDQWVSARKM